MSSAPRLALALALLVQGCAAINSRDACQVTKLTEVPLQVTNNQPVVDVKFGDRSARLLLDTGATHTILSSAAFARLGLNYDTNMSVTSTGPAGQTVARASQPTRVTIGGLDLPPTSVVSIADITVLDANKDVDGLLGVDSLAGFDLDLDMPRRTLGLYAGRQCPDGPAPFDGPSLRYKSAANFRHYLYVPVLADGHALSLIVDTGANRTFLSRRHLGLPDAATEDERTMKLASSGPQSISAQAHLFQTLSLGGMTVHNVRLLTGSMPFEQDGLLGTDYLHLQRAWLSFPGWTIILAR